ncbi:MAG: TadE/TadG family type IV pilus assembly protein [Blastocatellia bacterium]
MRRISSNNGIAGTDEQGSVIVELALMLPLLAMLILGSVDLGLIVREHQLLQNAAREGARFSAQPANKIDPVTPAATQVATAQLIRDRVINYLAQEKITIATTACAEDGAIPGQFNCGPITIFQQQPIVTIVGPDTFTDFGSAVSVTYDRAFLFSGGSLFKFNTVSLRGNSVFRNLYGN